MRYCYQARTFRMFELNVTALLPDLLPARSLQYRGYLSAAHPDVQHIHTSRRMPRGALSASKKGDHPRGRRGSSQILEGQRAPRSLSRHTTTQSLSATEKGSKIKGAIRTTLFWFC